MLKYKMIITFLAVLLGLGSAQAIWAQTDIFMEVPNIAGEAQDKDHQGWIVLNNFHYPVERAQRGSTGNSRSRSSAVVGPTMIGKQGDAASVYLNLATLQGMRFDEIVIEITEQSILKFRYTFSNVVFTSYTFDANEGTNETVGMLFESIRVLYIEDNEDGSAGTEHEIEYDIAAGV